MHAQCTATAKLVNCNVFGSQSTVMWGKTETTRQALTRFSFRRADNVIIFMHFKRYIMVSRL